jgi:mRNA interferase YafQ
MYVIFPTRQYRKSFKKLKHSGKLDEIKLNRVIDALCKGKDLDPIYKDHSLSGELIEYRECHIRGDLLLIYKIEKDKLILVLIDIGSYSYLFG